MKKAIHDYNSFVMLELIPAKYTKSSYRTFGKKGGGGCGREKTLE